MMENFVTLSLAVKLFNSIVCWEGAVGAPSVILQKLIYRDRGHEANHYDGLYTQGTLYFLPDQHNWITVPKII